MPVVAHYLLHAKDETRRPRDPVARFHLYSLADIERNHEAYGNQGVIAASPAVRALIRPRTTKRSRRMEPVERL